MPQDAKPSPTRTSAPAPVRAMTDAQRAYEAKRAQKAGMPLDKWLANKAKEAQAAIPKPEKPQRKPGLIARLLDRAHQPLKKR